MLDAKEIIQKLRALKPELHTRFHVARIGFFGSYATGHATPASDVDVLVEFAQAPGWDFFDLQDLLAANLGVPVDLVSIEALKPRLRDGILRQTQFV